MDTYADESSTIHRMLKIGAALAGGGMMISTIGMAISAIAVTRSVRVWTRQHDISPAAIAAARLDQAKHASIAGMHAWREHATAGADGHRGHAG